MEKGPNPTLEYWPGVGIYLRGIYKNNYIFRILTPINTVVIIFILMHCILSMGDQTFGITTLYDFLYSH